MTNEQARTLVGHRILAATQKSYNGTSVNELRVLELSPSGEWLKTMDLYGRRTWTQTATMACVEVLLPAEPRPVGKP